MKILITDLEDIITNDNGVFEDANAFLSGAHEKFFIVILTNSPTKEVQERINSLGLMEYIDFVISAGDYEMPKPDHRMINVLLALLNNEGKKFSKSDVVLVGRSPSLDIKLANNAGVQPIRVRRGKYSKEEPEYPDEVAKTEVKDLVELSSYLGIINKKKVTSKIKKNCVPARKNKKMPATLQKKSRNSQKRKKSKENK